MGYNEEMHGNPTHAQANAEAISIARMLSIELGREADEAAIHEATVKVVAILRECNRDSVVGRIAKDLAGISPLSLLRVGESFVALARHVESLKSQAAAAVG